MGYRRIDKWVELQGQKRGVPTIPVSPRGTSSRCPACHSKLKEAGHRRLRRVRCGLEEDRDVIAKLNIREEGLLLFT